MIYDIILSKPDKKELRKFAIMMFIILIILGGIFLIQKKDTGFVLITLGLILLLLGFFGHRILTPIYKIWMVLSLILGFIMNHFILAVIYYLVFTPIGFIKRILRNDPLQISTNRFKESYWIKKIKKELKKEEYEKMF